MDNAHMSGSLSQIWAYVVQAQWNGLRMLAILRASIRTDNRTSFVLAKPGWMTRAS